MDGTRPRDRLRRLIGIVDRVVEAALGLTMVLVLPVSLLLFLQWPLRELVQAYSREANDLAQLLFAIYVGGAVSYASRRQTHLAVDAFAPRYSPGIRAKLAHWVAAAVLIPWSSVLLYASWPIVVQSVRQLEAFPETFNPGYFVIKLALCFMAALVLLQAVIDAGRELQESLH